MAVRGIKHVSLSSPPLLTKGRLTVFQGLAALHGSVWAERCFTGVVSMFVAVGKKNRGVLGITELTEAEESLNGV